MQPLNHVKTALLSRWQSLTMVLKLIAAIALDANTVFQCVHTQQLLLLPYYLLQHTRVVLLKNP